MRSAPANGLLPAVAPTGAGGATAGVPGGPAVRRFVGVAGSGCDRNQSTPQQVARDVSDLDLVGPAVNLQDLGVTRELFDSVLAHVAVAAE